MVAGKVPGVPVIFDEPATALIDAPVMPPVGFGTGGRVPRGALTVAE
jgi:hypothetical protein